MGSKAATSVVEHPCSTVLGSPAVNGPSEIKDQKSFYDPCADGELKRPKGRMCLRLVFVSILFLASSPNSGVIYTWRLVLMAALQSG